MEIWLKKDMMKFILKTRYGNLAEKNMMKNIFSAFFITDVEKTRPAVFWYLHFTEKKYFIFE